MLIHKKARPVDYYPALRTYVPTAYRSSSATVSGPGFSNPPKHATKKVILQIKTKSKKTNRQSDQGRTSTSDKLNGNSLLMDSNDTLHSDKF